jgi:hypothetical protein
LCIRTRYQKCRKAGKQFLGAIASLLGDRRTMLPSAPTPRKATPKETRGQFAHGHASLIFYERCLQHGATQLRSGLPTLKVLGDGPIVTCGLSVGCAPCLDGATFDVQRYVFGTRRMLRSQIRVRASRESLGETRPTGSGFPNRKQNRGKNCNCIKKHFHKSVAQAAFAVKGLTLLNTNPITNVAAPNSGFSTGAEKHIFFSKAKTRISLE